MYQNGIEYCLLYQDSIAVARACLEKHSQDKWEVADVRVAGEYRGKGLGGEACRFVVEYILNNKRLPTIRTEANNISMKRIIEGLGFELIGMPSPKLLNYKSGNIEICKL